MNQVELAVCGQAGLGEVAAANNGHQRIEAVEQGQLVTTSAVKEVAFGMQKFAPSGFLRIVPEIEADLHIVAAQKTNDFFYQNLSFFVQRFGVEFVAQESG